MIRTYTQNKELHALIGQLAINQDQKQGLVLQYTNGRTGSSSKMQKMECQGLINALRSEVSEQRSKSDKLRKTIISLARQMCWENKDNSADMVRINNWCLSYGKFKKQLNSHSQTELVELISQFRIVVNSFLENL